MRADKYSARGNIAEHRVQNAAITSALDWIDPNQDRIYASELELHVVHKIIVVDGRLSRQAHAGQCAKDCGKAIVVSSRSLPRGKIAGVKDGNSLAWAAHSFHPVYFFSPSAMICFSTSAKSAFS